MNIAFSGKMTSGKSTCAEYAAQIMGFDKSERLSFADPIYEIAHDYFGMGQKDRSLLIWIGETFRAREPLIWVRLALEKVRELNARGIWVIVDDVRMQAEFDALRNAGFYMVRLNISELEQEKRIRELYPEQFDHHLAKRNDLTECSLDSSNIAWDIFIAHDLDLVLTRKSIETILNGARN